MKKLILVLAIALVASPALAALDVNLVLIDSDTVEVRYTGADVDNLPRAFALDLTIAGGTFDSISSYKTGESTSASKGYGIYPATIDINSSGVVADDGDPIAPATDPGATGTGLSTNRVILEFASLYYGDGNAPATSGTLCQLDFTKGTATLITMVDEDTYRGGLVFEDGSLGDVDANVSLAEPECLIGGNAFAGEYDKWVEYGKPDCWCFRKQCRGDADGVKTFLKPVMLPDLNVFKAAYSQTKAVVKTITVNGTPGICADFDHLDTFLKPVMLPDLNIFKAYYSDTDATVPQCDAAPVITGPYNFWTN